MSVLKLGTEPAPLELLLTAGQDLVDSVRLEAGPDNPDGIAEGTAIDWPEGTAAWLILRNRSGSEQRWDFEVQGAYLYLDVDAELVGDVSRDAKARLWIEYPAAISEGGPFVFAAGKVLWT